LGKPQAVRRFSDADLRCRLQRITIRGSIVGNRKDLAEALEFAAEG
jgi:D-arabinose 1-dehydrogenase-like Zn-dependent alcohol dehydrogenase